MQAPAEEQHFDLYLRAGADRFYFHNDNHGLTLTAERMNWRFDDRETARRFATSARCTCTPGAISATRFSMCTITFADRYKLIVLNSGGYGAAPDPERSELYRAFVRELHARLAASRAPFKFAAGIQAARYPLLIAWSLLIGLVCVVVPIGITIINRTIKPVFAVLAGLGLYWPITKLIEKNAPRGYDSLNLPDEVLG